MKLYKQAITLGVVLLVAAGAVGSVRRIQAAKPVAADYATLPTIVIDPGHGGAVNTI